MLAFEEALKDSSDLAVLEVRNLFYHYPNGHEALNDVSLRLSPGEKVAIIGPNGAGKSTLMLHLNGIIRPQKGRVQVNGLDTTPENLGVVRSMVGLVFQNPDDQLFSPRVFDDVAFGPLYMGLSPEIVEARVHQALEAVGMEGFAERRPFELSIGERKRVALATVLSMEPKVLVLDEPSAGLDPRARRGLIKLLAEIPLAMIVSTHDMQLVRDLFPRSIVMDTGRVVADGETAAILGDTEFLDQHGLVG